MEDNREISCDNPEVLGFSHGNQNFKKIHAIT